MEGRMISLSDGTAFAGSVGYSGGVIWCYIPGVSITDVFPAFSDPAKAGRIVFDYGEMQDTYDGFTVIGAMVQDGGQVNIMLKKEEV